MKRKPIKRLTDWTPDQLDLLEKLGAEGKLSWDEIGEACGHSKGSAQSTYHRRRLLAEAGGKSLPRKDGKRAYTPEEDAEICSLVAQGITRVEIAKRLNRSAGSVIDRYYRIRSSAHRGRPEPGTQVPVTPSALADRDARYRLRLQQSQVDELMGDPLPGRSARDGFTGMSRNGAQ